MAGSTASVMAKTFLECIELSEGFTDYPIKPASSSSTSAAAWHSPRISFSNEFAQINEDEQQQGGSSSPTFSHKPSSSGEFEFNMAAPTMQSPLSADELFYKGKLLPLHLPPRIRMVQDLCEDSSKQLSRSPALGMMRRERSLRSPARPAFIPTTLKSSSYPPPGYSSRPSSPPKVTKCAGTSSRWRDLFGFKKPQPSTNGKALPPLPTPPSKQSSKFLKMIFNRGSTTTAPSSDSLLHHPDHHREETTSSSSDAFPLLRDAALDASGSGPEQMVHSSSTSSSASSSWAASSASSSTASTSSFSADFPEVTTNTPTSNHHHHHPPASIRKFDKVGGRQPVLTRSPRTRRGIPPRTKPIGGLIQGSTLARTGSNRRPISASGLGAAGPSSRMQLQDHIHMNSSCNNGSNRISTRPQSDNWRRPENSKSANPSSSSVRVTPVLHVPACIGPSSLRNVKVHGFRRLFSSSSASGSGKPPAHHPDNTVAVM